MVGSSYGLAYCKGQLFQQFQQVSQQLRALQEQQQVIVSKQIPYPDNYYYQNCVNTPEDAISLVGFSRSSSVRSRNRLSVLIEDPSYNNKQTSELDYICKDGHLSKSPSLFSANISSHLFTDPEDQHYNGPEIEPLDDSEPTCYLAEKLDAEDKFVPFEDRNLKDQQDLIQQQLRQQRLAFKEERQAAAHLDKLGKQSKHKQTITSVQDNSQATRHHHKRSFLLRRSNSSKTTSKTKKAHIPQIQVTEF